MFQNYNSIGDQTTGLKYESNEDLVIYIQNEPPKGKGSNWLPAPKKMIGIIFCYLNHFCQADFFIV